MAVIKGLKIVYGLYDHTIDTDTKRELSATSQTDYAKTSTAELLDVAEDWKSLTYLETDYWLLDGEQVCPKSTTAQYTGWESSKVYDAGTGAGSDTLTFTFASTHDSYGIRLIFPEDAIPAAFTITYYSGSTEVGTRSVEENTAAEYSNTDNRLAWDKVTITFTQTQAGRRARLLQVYFGIVDTYDNDSLIKVTASRTADIANDYEDCGTLTFELFNSGRFAVSSIKDLPDNLQSGQECYVYIISPADTTDLFMTYSSDSTAIKDDGRSITITAYDLLYSLGETTYSKGIVQSTWTLKDWAQDVAEDAGISITIEDDAGTLATIVTGYIAETTHREALRLIAEAGNAVLYVDRGNSLHMKSIKAAPATDTYTDNDIVQDSYSESNEADYKRVELTAWTLKLKSQPEGLATYDNEVCTGSKQKYDITYSRYPVDVSTVQIAVTNSACKVYGIDDDGNIVAGTCTDSIYWTVPSTYAEHVVFYLEGTADATTTITITGTAYSQTSNDYAEGDSTTGIKRVNKNYLITETNAQAVLDYLYSKTCNRFEIEAEVLPPMTAAGAYPTRTDPDTNTEGVYIESDILDTITFTGRNSQMTCTKVEMQATADSASWTVSGESRAED